MSITGSLVGYENNNDLSNKKNRSLLNVTSSSKQCASLNSSISNSIITTASSNVSVSKSNHQNSNNESMQTKNNNKRKHRYHLNALWSIWYGVFATYLQGYLILHGAYRFLGCYFIQWRGEPPLSELNAQIILCGFALVTLPLFFISTIFKVGNLANDGTKLATASQRCSAEPEDGLEHEAKGGTLRAIWTHGGPTSAFLHIVVALCLLIPRLMLESRLIENGNLPRENIWHTELDFMVTHRDRLVILSFMTTSPYQNNSIDDEGDGTKVQHRPIYSDDEDLSHTHLIEKFHSGTFDEADYFDTHEKLEIDTAVPTSMTTVATITPVIKQPSSPSSSSSSSPSGAFNKASTTNVMNGGEAVNATESNSNRKQHARTKQRNNGLASSGRGTGKKQSSGPRQTQAVATGEGGERDNINHFGLGKKEKNHRRGDDVAVNEKFEIKSNNKKFNSDKINSDFGEQTSVPFNAVTKLPKKQMSPAAKETRIVDIVDELPPDHGGFEMNGHASTGAGRKSSIVRDSNILIVKPASDGSIIPSTPISTDSKIIEIKPSTIRASKRAKRASNTADNALEEANNDDDDDGEDESDMQIPRIYVNVENNEQFIEDDNVYMKPAPAAITAALIGAVPVNATTMTTKAVHLHGFAGFLQKYLKVNKEIDTKNWTSGLPSLEFLNLVLALIVWSSRYPSVFWGTSKPFAIVFSIQMIANAIDLLLGFAGVSVIYKLQIVGQQLPLQTPPLLLNGIVSLLLYILSILLIISSSLILYLYGHGRLSSRMRDRRMISTKTGDTWAYFAHCASLCFILALAVVKAPLMHDFSAIYKGSLDGAVLTAALASVMHIFFWILLWLGLTAKRRWNFKLPPLHDAHTNNAAASQPLLLSPRPNRHNLSPHMENGEETIYWPKLTPSSPKLKVTFNDVPSTLSDNSLAEEQNGKRNPCRRTSICLSNAAGEIDDGDYATLRAGTTGDLIHFNAGLAALNCDTADDTSEEGKLLDCVRDDSVTYASTRDLEPPMPPPPPPPPLEDECNLYVESTEIMVNPLAPVTVTVHTNETHISSHLTPRCIRRADSGMPHDVLTPRSESTSTECSTSPPERAQSDSSSSGVHSGEERDEVVIRPRQAKVIVKPPQPAIQEEPFGRSTNMIMSSFNKDLNQSNAATLPINRAQPIDVRHDYTNHCSTMPLPINCHQQQYRTQQFITPNASKTQLHTTLPNGVRYANPTNFMRRVPLHVQTADSPYGILGLGAGHHTFSKLLHDPLMFNSIPEDRDSANYSMISEHDREMYVNSAGNLH